MKNKIYNMFNMFDEHLQELLRGASIALLLKVLAACFTFGLNVLLARLLGAEGSGIFFLALTIVIFIAAIGRIGMENSIVRFISTSMVSNQFGSVLGVYQKAMLFSLIITTILSVILFMLTPWISDEIFNKPELTRPLSIMIFATIPLALLTLCASALQGLKKIAASISVLSLFVPLLTCTIAILVVPNHGISAAALGYLLSTIVTLFVGILLWRRKTLPYKYYKPAFSTGKLLSNSGPLFVSMLLNIIITRSPMLFLGIWESNANVGIYSAASRTALLISFVLIAVNNISAPKFSAIYHTSDMVTLNSLVQNATKIMVLFSSPIFFIFICFPEWILFLFGDEFRMGALVLQILAIGQYINILTGSTSILLMMSGFSRELATSTLISALILIVLSLYLIPIYGILGAAISTSLTILIQKTFESFLVWKKLQILVIPLTFKLNFGK